MLSKDVEVPEGQSARPRTQDPSKCKVTHNRLGLLHVSLHNLNISAVLKLTGNDQHVTQDRETLALNHRLTAELCSRSLRLARSL